MQDITLFSSAARTTTTNSNQVAFNGGAAYAAVFNLNISAASGSSPTLVVKIQGQDPTSGNFYDIPGAAFASKATTGTDALIVHPAITTSTGVATSQVLPRVFRAVATIGGSTPSFTFTLTASSLGV